MEYTLEIKDILAYVASKQDHEVVGVTGSPMNCLGARTLEWKYPRHGFCTGNLDFFSFGDPDLKTYPVGPGVTYLLDQFDVLGYHSLDYLRITKRELLDSGILEGLSDAV